MSDLSGPIELHHAAGDASVPIVMSEILYEQGQAAGMPIDFYAYPGDNHNISVNFNTAMARSVAFFDRWLKQQPIDLAESDGPIVFARNGVINLRAGPGTEFDVVGQLGPGEILSILGSNIDRSWWQVQTPSGPAWVAESVTLAVRTETVPVVEEAAGPGGSRSSKPNRYRRPTAAHTSALGGWR